MSTINKHTSLARGAADGGSRVVRAIGSALVAFAVCAIAAWMVARFAWIQRDAMRQVYASLFSIYDLDGRVVSGWLLTATGAVCTALAATFVVVARLLMARSAAFGLRAALFAVCFASGLLAMPILSQLRIVEAPEFDAKTMGWAVLWCCVALAAGAVSVFLWERWLPAWAIYLLAFGAGLAALGVIQPQQWDPVFYCAAGWLVWCALIGHLTLRCCDTYLPPRAHVALALVIGLTVTGVAVELLAMAHLFSRWPIVAIAVALTLILAVAAGARMRRPLRGRLAIEGAQHTRTILRNAALERYEASILRARGAEARFTYQAALWLTAAITALTFYHGMGYPEAYWDSLILYLGYARMTFLEQAFHFKAVAQVGIGLGANYPHLYPTLVATGPALAGQWSTIGGQLVSPLAGALSCVLVYHIALRLTRQETLAALTTLLFRCVPLGIAYFIYASDYSVAVLFTVAFVYLAILYIETAVPGYLAALTLVCAGAAHINYLMLALWAAWALTIVLAHAGRRLTPRDYAALNRERDAIEERARQSRSAASTASDDPARVTIDELLPYAEDHPRASLLELARSKWFWSLTAAGLLLASTWYVRNTVLTGNPVYAFFPQWLGGIRINPFVLESCGQEWMANGMGLARVADQRLGIPYDQLTVGDKLAALPWFFYSYGAAWVWQPFFFGWVLPGVALALGWLLWRAIPWRGAKSVTDADRPGFRFALRIGDLDRVGLLAVFILAMFLCYHIAIADFYLYQIMPVLAVWPVFFVYALEAASARPWRQIMTVCIVAAALAPGLPMALIGMKYHNPDLRPLRQPGMSQREIIALVYGDDDARMFDAVNERCAGRAILTHENRHLLFDPSITLAHLDDWEAQQLWGLPPDAVLAGLKKQGVTHYLRVPNEFKHPINRRLGVQALIDEQRLRLVGQWGANELYEIP